MELLILLACHCGSKTDSNVEGAYIEKSEFKVYTTKTKSENDTLGIYVFAEKADCKIVDTTIDVNSNECWTEGIFNYGNTKVSNTNVLVNNSYGTVQGIFNKANAMLSIENSNMNVNSDYGSCYGIGNFGKSIISNTNIFTDASESTADGGNKAYSVGIANKGELKFYSGSVYGTHSGIDNGTDGKLYVYGGTFDGFGHGGIYFAQGPNGEAYVENATLKSGEYNGKHDSNKFSDRHGGSFYIGSASNNKVYMDRCTLSSVSGPIGVLRGTGGETNNQLYISNSTIENGKKIRIDGKNKLFVGKGMNVTEEDVTLSKDKNNYIPTFTEAVEFTNEEYKR